MKHEAKLPEIPELCPKCTLKTEPNTPFCTRCQFDLRYGTESTKSGACIYCPYIGKLTEEHIFPDWLNQCFPRRHTKRRTIRSRPESAVFYEDNPLQSIEINSQGDPYTKTVRNVCASCNNGWMATLQNLAKPIVKNLANSVWLPLTHQERLILARWVTMVSINLEYDNKILQTTQLQRTELMNGAMPSGWNIYAGILENTDSAGDNYSGSIIAPMGIGEDEYLAIQSSYFCIEKVIFHSISCFHDNVLAYAKYYVPQLQEDHPLSWIWPLQHSIRDDYDVPLNSSVMTKILSYTRYT